VATEQEMTQLRSGIDEAKSLEQRRTDLQHRVATVLEMRTRPTLPVRLLDHLSRSLPDAVWLTEVQQQNDKVTIEGRAPTLTEISELVGRLGDGPLLRKPIEIVSSRMQSGTEPGRESGPVDLLQFSISAQIAEPGSR
jgi:type IV pilus assembly protein PilN